MNIPKFTFKIPELQISPEVSEEFLQAVGNPTLGEVVEDSLCIRDMICSDELDIKKMS